MKNKKRSPIGKIIQRMTALSLTVVSLVSCASIPVSAFGSLALGSTAVNLTATTSISESMMAEQKKAGIYWFGSWRDLYQALNLQFDDVTAGLVLDGMNFEANELWILTPISPNSVYFTLAPLSHPGYYITGQSNDNQLRLSKTSASNPAVQWYAVPDGDHYVLMNRKTGLAMDTAHGLSDTGNPVLNYTRNGYQDAQSWSMVLVSESTTGISSGIQVTINDGAYAVLAAGDLTKCLNDQFASTAGDGTAKICLDTWNQEPNETLIFTNRGNGQYTISPSHAPNVCLNVWAADPTAGNQLTLATYQEGDQCSLWEIYKNNDNTYSLRNVKTGLWLNLWGNSHVDGAKIVGYQYDGTIAMKWNLQAVSAAGTSSGASSGASAPSGYAAYTGVNYRALTTDSRRIAACDKAVQMATVLWTASCDFPTWKSAGGVYNTVTATDGTRSTKFISGKTYQGIPYSMVGRTYDDTRWAALVQNGLSTSLMTGAYYASTPNTTGKGIDCSYLVCTALNAGCGTSINMNTKAMLASSRFTKISRTQMQPGDIFLTSGHVIFFMGKTSDGKYAVIEANADYSRVVYRELPVSSLYGYGCYRYAGFR